MYFRTYLNVKSIIINYFNTLPSKNSLSYLSPNTLFFELSYLKYISSFNTPLSSQPSQNTFFFKNSFFKKNCNIVFLDILSAYLLNNIQSKSYHNLCIILSPFNNTWKIDFIISRELMPLIFNNLSNGHFSLSTIRTAFEKRLSYFKSLDIQSPSNNFTSLQRIPSLYSPEKAIKYAEKYALNYNPDYNSFANSGGDCTNFASQTLFFAGLKKTKHWTPYSHAWIRVQSLRDYIVHNNLGREYFSFDNRMSGSLIQFFHSQKKRWTHSGILTFAMGNDYLYCCHSYDKLNYPLSLVYPSIYSKIRIIKFF